MTSPSIKISPFVKSVFMLVTGTALAQLIGFAVLPILTRIYTPQDFELLSIFLALLGVFSCSIGLRFDVAIPIPKSDEKSAYLFLLSIFSNLILSFFLLVFFFLFADKIANLLNDDRIEEYYAYFIISASLLGMVNSFQFYMTRKSFFKGISVTKVTQVFTASLFQIVLGIQSGQGRFLIIGQMLNFFTGFVIYFLYLKKSILPRFSIRKLKSVAIEYKKFPLFSSFESLLNIGSIQLPVLIIAYYSIGPEAGFLMLAMKMTQAPLTLFGTSIGQVYLSKAPKKYIDSELEKFTYSVIKGLCKVGIGPILFLGVVSPFIFSFVFGEEWGIAGTYVLYMAPWFFFQFITAPVSMAIHITGHQGHALLFQVFGFLLRVVSIIYVGINYSEWLIETYAVSGLIYYIAYLLFIVYCIKTSGYKGET